MVKTEDPQVSLVADHNLNRTPLENQATLPAETTAKHPTPSGLIFRSNPKAFAVCIDTDWMIRLRLFHKKSSLQHTHDLWYSHNMRMGRTQFGQMAAASPGLWMLGRAAFCKRSTCKSEARQKTYAPGPLGLWPA